MHVIGAHDHSHTFGGLRGIRSLSFGDQVRLGDPTTHQVIVSYAALSEVKIVTRASRGDDNRRYAALEEFKRMIQPRPVYRRRTPGILGSAEDYDRIRGMNFLL
jgi:hypothetical protein